MAIRNKQQAEAIVRILRTTDVSNNVQAALALDYASDLLAWELGNAFMHEIDGPADGSLGKDPKVLVADLLKEQKWTRATIAQLNVALRAVVAE